jgi:hypothetical protein
VLFSVTTKFQEMKNWKIPLSSKGTATSIPASREGAAGREVVVEEQQLAPGGPWSFDQWAVQGRSWWSAFRLVLVVGYFLRGMVTRREMLVQNA